MADEQPPDVTDRPSFQDIAKAILSEYFSPDNLTKLAKNAQNVALEAKKDGLDLLWKAVAFLPIKAAQIILGVMRGGEAEFDELAQVAIDGLFGDGGVQHGRAREMTATASAKLLDMMSGGGRNTEPGEENAAKYLDTVLHLSMEGWMQKWIVELVSDFFPEAEKIERFGELKDDIAQAIGLSRLSRRVFGPYVKTFITDPTTWALNKKHRPKMLGAGEAAVAMFRGDIDEATFTEIAQRDGYGDEAIAAIVNAQRKNLSPADLYLLFQLGLQSKEWAIAQLRASGLDVNEAELWFTLQEAKSLRTYQLEAAQSAVTAYGNRGIDDTQLADELDHLGLDQTTLDRFHAEATRRRRLNVKLLSRGDVEAAIENGILGVADYDDWLEANGYGHNDALTLQLLLLAKMQKLEDARAARSQAAAARESQKASRRQDQQLARDRVAAEHAHWTGTLGEAERLVIRNVMPPNQYRQVLIDHGLSAGDADALTSVAVRDRDDRAAAAAKRLEAAAKGKQPIVSLATLERGVLLGKRSIADFRAELVTRKYTDADVALITALVQQDVADRAAAQLKRDAAAAALQLKSISLAQLEAAVLAGERTVDDYRQLLTQQKYSSSDVATLVGLLQQRVTDRALAEERHALAVQKLEASKLSLAEEEAAVLAGIVTFDDYTLYLEAHGFDVDDQAILTALLFEKWQKKNGGA